MSGVSDAPTPSLSHIVNWDTTHLEEAARHWSATAEQWEEHFTAIHRETLSPGGTVWEGDGAEAAQERTFADLVKVRGAADTLRSAAGVARHGADDLSWLKRRAVAAIAEAEDASFIVGESLSITDRSATPLFRVAAVRQLQVETLAADIRARAQNLASMDKTIAGKITAALAPLGRVTFTEEPDGQGAEPAVEAVDYRHFKDAPIPPAPPPPPPTATSIQDAIKDLPPGKQNGVRVVRDPQQLRQFEDWITQHGTRFASDPPYRGGQGSEYRLSDGTEVRLGPSQKFGPTVDMNLPEDQVTLPDGKSIKLHVDVTEGGDIMLPIPTAPEVAPQAPAGEPLPAKGFGGPGAPAGPQLAHLPGSVHHPFPILGEDDPAENPRDFEGHQ